MATKSKIEDFLSQQKIAIVGVSRNSKKFGNIVYKDLKKKGYQVFPINPHVSEIEGDPCFPGVDLLPEKVNGMVFITQPEQSEKVLVQAEKAGIKKVWLQQGAESDTAIKFCEENNIDCIYGECIMMFAEPVESFHKFHRWLWKVIGKLPK
jgi:uncharacterized protein